MYLIGGVIVTGCSTGLGLALTNYYLFKNFKIYGMSRTTPDISNINFIHKSFDLSDISEIKNQLSDFIKDIKEIVTVFFKCWNAWENQDFR